MDRTDWKAYILPLLFFKRICDVWDEETEEAAEIDAWIRQGKAATDGNELAEG